MRLKLMVRIIYGYWKRKVKFFFRYVGGSVILLSQTVFWTFIRRSGRSRYWNR